MWYSYYALYRNLYSSSSGAPVILTVAHRFAAFQDLALTEADPTFRKVDGPMEPGPIIWEPESLGGGFEGDLVGGLH